MKKVLVLVAVVISASFASCKKDYVCKCTSGGYTSSAPIGKVTKKDAKKACDDASGGVCSSEKA